MEKIVAIQMTTIIHDTELLQIAKVIMQSDYSSFETFLQDRENMPFRDFCLKYEDLIQSEVDCHFDDRKDLPTEQWRFSEDDMQTDDLFLMYAQWKDRLAMEDWPGEMEHGETAGTINRMLARNWNRAFDWNSKAYYESIDFSRLARGNVAVLVYKTIDEHLKTMGFRFVSIDTESDCYYFGVLPIKDFEQIHGLRWKHFTVEGIKEICRGYKWGGWLDIFLSWFGVKKPYAIEVLERYDDT